MKLWVFDNDVVDKDAKLKQSEMDVVKDYLLKHNRFEKSSSYLDVGTCTGRYPFELSKSLNLSCNIVGIDSDNDCIDYVKVKRKVKMNDGVKVQNISFRLFDLLLSNDGIGEEIEKFDLITCMLGTICHFGWDIDKTDALDDSLQRAIRKMTSMLSDDGLLIISNWTHVGIDNDMLSIYNANDLRILRQGSERPARFKHRLAAANLSFDLAVAGADKELNLYFCQSKR
jgi:SAM-dependent methyltransferase